MQQSTVDEWGLCIQKITVDKVVIHLTNKDCPVCAINVLPSTLFCIIELAVFF